MKRYAFLFFLFCQLLNAKTFTNSYLTFELPNDWDCVLAGTEWVCSPTSKSGQREATLILAAKGAGPEDRLDTYQKYLSKIKNVQTQSGVTTQSKIITIAQINLSNQPWIEAVHLNSEIEDYYTRYLATVKQHLSILMTMSAHQSVWNMYEPVFSKIKNSLRIIASQQLLANPPEKIQTMSQSPQEIPVMNNGMEQIPTSSSQAPSPWKQPFVLIGVALAVIVFGLALYLRK